MVVQYHDEKRELEEQLHEMRREKEMLMTQIKNKKEIVKTESDMTQAKRQQVKQQTQKNHL